MSPYVERFVERLRDAEDDLKRDVDEQQQRWQYRVHRGRVWFDKELRENHRRMRQTIPAYILEGNLLSLLTAPIIYSLLFPLVLLDVWVTLYQLVCFPIYGIARVQRRQYFTIDRHKLAYLNGIEKVHCTFCSCANGAIAYVREVAGRTEQYWCPIKHARAIPTPHQRYHVFFDFYNGSIAFAITGLFLASAAWATFDSGVLPRWTGWIAVAGAILCAASVPAMYSGPVNYSGFYNAGGWGPAIVANFPPMIWFLTVSVILIRHPGIGRGVIVRAA